MSNTYSIAHLAASAYLGGRGMGKAASAYICDEGAADMVTADGDTTVLVALSAKRQRGEGAKAPEYSAGRLKRVAMSYLVEHPEVSKLRFDVLEVLVGSNATATVNAVEGAYSWER